jgi:hypothetical protein
MKESTRTGWAIFPAAEVFAGLACDHTGVGGVRQLTLTPFGLGLEAAEPRRGMPLGDLYVQRLVSVTTRHP